MFQRLVSVLGTLAYSRGRARDTATDAELVERARRESGGPAFDALVGRYHARLVSLLRPLVGSLADDIAQEAFVRSFLALDRFRETSGFWPWLRVIAVRLARNRLRDEATRRRYQAASQDDQAHELGRPGEVLDKRRALLAALSALEYAERELLLLHYLEGLSVRELAGLFQASPSAVKMRLMRARTRLKEQLSP